MEKVYLLWHTHTFSDGREDDKLIGVYESYVAAKAAQLRALGRPGFVDGPEGFLIDEYMLNKDHWQSGYVTA